MAAAKIILTQHQKEVIQTNTADDGARILGIDRSTLTRLCKREGITFKRIYSAATPEGWLQNKQIRQGHKAGLSIKEIMRQTNAPAWKVRQLLKLPNKGEVFKHLDAATIDWLENECPEGMDLHEFIAVIVTDAYQEDQE